MTPEERWEHIDRTMALIADRHAALAQTAEILAAMFEANEKANEKRFEVLTSRTIQAMDAINRLARIADNHEQGIEDMEDRP